jgi:hypothetical protein
MSNGEDNDGGFFNNPTRRVGGGADKTVRRGSAEAPTVASNAGIEPNPDNQNQNSDHNPQTRRVRPGSSASESDPSATATAASQVSHPEFVVGWLVVIEGSGRGMSRPLGYGMNPVGREEETGVQLNFGDEEISRKAHCQIAYDHKNKKFYIQHGGGQNLTYLGNVPVLASSELPDQATISIGNTTLKFVQLCGDEFDWD